MEGAKVGRHTNRKRQVSNSLKRVKQLDPVVNPNEQMGLSSEPTPKNKKVMPESSLGRDHNWESPAEGQPAVVFALPANQSGAKNVQQSNSLAGTVERNCYVNLDDDLPLCHLYDEHKRRVHSDPGNKHLLACGKKFSITSILNHSPNFLDDNLDCFGGEISSKSPTTSSIDLKVAGDTISEVQNQEVPPDSSVDIASKTANIHQSGTKRKGYSDRGNIHMSKSGRNNFSKTLVNNDLEQNLKEYNLDPFGGKFSTSLVTAVVNHMVNDDASCKTQNQEGPFEKSLQGASKAEHAQDKACSSQPDIRGVRWSVECSTLELGNGSDKSVRFRTLTNGHLDRNSMGEKSDQFNGQNSDSRKTALFSPKKIDGDPPCEVQKQAVALNKSTAACPGSQQEHDEVEKRRSDRIKKRLLESGATTSGTSASKDDQNGDNSILLGVKKNEVRLDNGLMTVPKVSNNQEDLCGAPQKRKGMVHSDQKNKTKSRSGSICVSDIDNSVLDASYPVSLRNERNSKVLSNDNLKSKSLFDCSHTDLNHTSCCETEPSSVDLQNLRTYHRKDKSSCYLTSNLELGIDNGCYEVSLSCSNALTENAELEQKNGYSDDEILDEPTRFSLDGNLIAGKLPSSRVADNSCDPCLQNGDCATNGDDLRGALAISPKHPVEQICHVTVDSLAQDRGTLSEDVGNDPCSLNEGFVLGCISTDVAEASKHPVEQICDVTIEALASYGGSLREDVGHDPSIQNQSVVLGRVSTDVRDASKPPVERICEATVDALAQESGTLSADVVDDPCVQDQSVLLGCASKDLADTSKHPVQEFCEVTGDSPPQERGALFEDVGCDPFIQNQSVVPGHVSTNVAVSSMVVIGGVSVHSRHMGLYRQIVDHFGPFVHLESKEMKVWGHTTFVMLAEFLDTVARFMHVIHKDISEDDLEFLEIRFNKFDGFGFSVGWFQKYIAQLRELPSLDVRIREIEAQLVFAEQERDKLENQIRLSRIELGELRQRRKASVDVFGTTAV